MRIIQLCPTVRDMKVCTIQYERFGFEISQIIENWALCFILSGSAENATKFLNFIWCFMLEAVSLLMLEKVF